MAIHASRAPARPESPSLQQIAVAQLGARLIVYRVNRRPAQREQLLGMLAMAQALGALPTPEHQALTTILDQLQASEVAHG